MIPPLPPKLKLDILFLMANNSTAPYFRYFMQEARERNCHRFSFAALTPERPSMIDDAAALGWDCHWIPFDHRHRRTQGPLAVARLLRILRATRPNVVHSHLFDDSLPGMLAARLAGIRCRVATKGDASYHYYHTPQWTPFDRFVNFNATDVVALSNESRDFIVLNENCDSSKVTVIHHGLPRRLFDDAPAPSTMHVRAKFGSERFIIGTAARFIRWKGHEMIIQVAREVVRVEPRALFVWAGTGDLEGRLRGLVHSAGLDSNVEFLGQLPEAEMPAFFGSLDAYLHAAFMEPFGLVIAEAMMAGVPVVSTPTGAALDAIENGVSGWLGSYSDPGSLAAGLIHLIRHPVPRPFLPARKRAREFFSFSDTFDKHIALYCKRLGGGL